MTKEQILELAKICELGDFTGKEEQLLKFAHAIYDKGVEEGEKPFYTVYW